MRDAPTFLLNVIVSECRAIEGNERAAKVMSQGDSVSTNDLFQRLLTYWSAQGVSTRLGASSDEIETFERRYGVRMPADLRAYFLAVDGMEEGLTDDDMFSFVPLHCVKNVPEDLANFRGIPDYGAIMQTLPDAQNWFVIVDYLIRSAACAIRLGVSEGGNSVLWIDDGENHRVVASSFSGFVAAYLDNPMALVVG